MAQLVAAPPAERISQILPTVKCSTCNQPVRISDLGDHVCAPIPLVPQIPALKPPQSPRSVAALLPAKLQGLVNGPPPVQSPPRTSSISQAPSRQKSPAPRQSLGRPRAPSSVSSLSVRSGDSRPERVPSPLARDGRPSTDKVPFPSPPGPSEPSRIPSPRIPAPSRPSDVPAALAARASPGIDRSATPGRSNIAAPGTTALRPRAPSSASLRPGAMVNGQGGARQPAQSNPPPSSGARYDPFAGPAPGASMSPPSRSRAGTNASMRPSFDQGPEIIYSTDMRSRTPANDPARMRTPSAASMRPSMDQMRPSMDQGRPSMDQMRRPSAESQRPFMGGAPPPPATPPVGSPPAREPDTKSGGEAGMAGVGRRGFAAAARAAMFTSMGPAPPMSPDPGAMGPMMPNQGMDGRRANAPRFLDIASATRYAATTPPLSPGSGTASMSPHSPYSQKSPVLAGLPSPNARMSPNITPTQAAGIASSPTSPMSVHSLRDRVLSPPQEVPKIPAAAEPPSTPRLPFFEKFKNKLPAVDTAKAADSTEPSPVSPASSDSSYGGLAYANSDDEDELDIPLRASPQPIATPAKKADSKATAPATDVKVRFPSMTNSESKYSSSSSSTESPRLPQRSLSASTSRTIAKSTGALDRAMETLFEESPTSPTTSTGSRPFTEAQRDSVSKSPKLPMRSHTSPTLSSGRLEQRKSAQRRPKTKTCVRCEKTIEDGRWIQMEGGNVLCDRCWKNMYLPKCRRCNKTIEKAAVSSSDGQLKGKWHRECFSCFTCEKPFPDKSFYVYDGKPFCAYHYHEANNSLCAAARCGQPIEGPCAVSHAGDRYHPEHFLCEYRGCTERLVEYYELDGRMLCERHVQKAMREHDEDEDEAYDDVFGGAGNRNTMAMKRVTRFIDLAALGPPS
ncbi:hypothetical protein L226DRAFT_566840 [Lentinus tigrinus ALCF2SS1-7]|uniref:LIM zinc-binding domain-containing protein n=1 Tax=Lentinus tigrinus ALCF2SS1-6 TaxID=1328759 RepID=A0A5C2SR92_9APHY|nr:hypothetical protein L227DRAFT_492920 [Lentinus tigrinus ALCF2SS1-6]RPD80336.1 hypothetical protein L226DRAFT_566840 [Lentinus tigrinus ALCF2SS1-7]